MVKVAGRLTIVSHTQNSVDETISWNLVSKLHTYNIRNIRRGTGNFFAIVGMQKGFLSTDVTADASRWYGMLVPEVQYWDGLTFCLQRKGPHNCVLLPPSLHTWYIFPPAVQTCDLFIKSSMHF